MQEEISKESRARIFRNDDTVRIEYTNDNGVWFELRTNIVSLERLARLLKVIIKAR